MGHINEQEIEKVETTSDQIEEFLVDIRRRADRKIGDVFGKSKREEQFLWGSEYHKADELEYKGYSLHLKSIIFSFLIDKYYIKEVSPDHDLVGEVKNHPKEFVSRSMGLDSNKLVHTRELGMYSPIHDEIWVKFLPEEELIELKSQLKSKLGNKKVDNILVKFVNHYNSINSLDKDDRTWSRFLATLEHERTHRFIAKESKIKSDLIKSIQSPDESKQIKEVADTTELTILDEVFGHYVGWKIDHSDKPAPGEYDGGEKYLVWGIKYLEKYYQRSCSSLEDIRSLENKVFSRILNKGQLDSKGQRINPFIYFIEQSLSASAQKRIENLRRLNTSEIRQLLSEISNILPDSRNHAELRQDVRSLQKLKSVSERTLEYLLERSQQENLGPQEIEGIISSFIEEETEDIEEILMLLEGYQTSDPEANSKISKLESHCSKCVKDLNDI